MSDYIQLAFIRGHSNKTNNAIEMVLDDFYTLFCKNPETNTYFKNNHRQDFNIIFKTTDISLDYLCSDFVRFCLALYKNNPQLSSGNMTLIPIQPIPISQELQEYIEEFLPDFYNIRDIVK